MHLTIASDPVAVRSALDTVLASTAMLGLGDCARGTAEIVLAEVLNNIVEHAYARTTGEIQLRLVPKSDGVFVAVCDQGRAFPHEQLPQGILPVIDVDAGLPEGGFGWFLIRTLVQDLRYQRTDTTNHLSFTLLTDAEPDSVH
ncbi:ATP-binding protein [Pseudorhodobacter ferrugineus]|uniref:ATP-binding protein n=1 Tax=Pseudorhodobacter ferrugineus TaxID=77008 RepID=UPI000A7710E2|nr:ATP-binding protein [Pseudorhodobacter ferrugineus]